MDTIYNSELDEFIDVEREEYNVTAVEIFEERYEQLMDMYMDSASGK